MKKIIMFSIAIFTASVFPLKAQNLFPNWSFEQYDTCPNASGRIYWATGWKNIMIDPDYYNACDTRTGLSVPTALGYPLYPYLYTDTTGNGDAGIDAYEICLQGCYPPNLHEILGCKLYSPLVIGKKYFVSLAVRLGLVQGTVFNGAISKLGALFSTVSYAMPFDSINYTGPNVRASKALIKNHAQVYTNKIITDTAFWTVISGSFVADSAYSFINIGDFFDDTLSNFTLIYNDTSHIHDEYAYYFIDDICVTSDSLSTCANVWTGENSISTKIDTMVISPNPLKQFANINMPFLSNSTSNNARLSIFDMLGKRVRDGTIILNNGEYFFKRENLSNGMYFIFIETENKIFKQKIVIIN